MDYILLLFVFFTQAVATCQYSCKNSSSELLGSCTECLPGKVLVYGFCLDSCPANYARTEDGISCDVLTDCLKLNFHRIERSWNSNFLQDVLNITSSTSQEPASAYLRGTYFNNSILQGDMDKPLLGPSFTISLNFLAQNLQSGTLFHLSKNSDLVLRIYMQDFRLNLLIKVMKSTSHQDVSLICPSVLSQTEWTHAIFSVKSESTGLTIKCSINDLVESVIIPDAYFEDNSKSLSIGSSVRDSDFFKGFIYDMNFYSKAYTKVEVYEKEYTDTCQGQNCYLCPIDLGECLSNCKINQAPDELCSMCHNDCIEGCRYNDRCTLCSDINCLECKDYNDDTCMICRDGFILDSNSRCVCDKNTYYSNTTRSCEECSEVCNECTGSSALDCKSCSSYHFRLNDECVKECPVGYTPHSNICTPILQNNRLLNQTSYPKCHQSCDTCFDSQTEIPWIGNCLSCKEGYLLDLFCIDSCPAGYQAFENNCISIVDPVLSFTFHNLTNTISSISPNSTLSFSFQAGSTSRFFPNYDDFDPRSVYLRGYYFNESYMVSTPISYFLPPTFILSFIFKPVHLYGTLLDLANLKVQLKPDHLSISFRTINDSTHKEQHHFINFEDITLNQWQHSDIRFLNGLNGLEVFVSINNITLSKYYEYEYFVDTKDDVVYIGAQYNRSTGSLTNFYSGYLYEFNVHYPAYEYAPYNVDILDSCEECIICPASLGMCLSECGMAEAPDSNCKPCLKECRECRNSYSCNMCDSEECTRCDGFRNNQCTECRNGRQPDHGTCCGLGKFYDFDMSLCQDCHGSCRYCRSSYEADCLECIDSLYLVDGYCLLGCPINYSIDIPNQTCTPNSDLLLRFSLTTLTGVITDSLGSDISLSTPTGSFYPKYSYDSPIAYYSRGYYFNYDSYLESPAIYLLTSPSFTISFIIKVESIDYGAIFTCNGESIRYYIYVILGQPMLRILDDGISDIYRSFSCNAILPLYTWAHLSLSIYNTMGGLYFKCVIDGQLINQEFTAPILKPNHNAYITIGSIDSYSSFQGFLYEISIYSSQMDVLTTYSDSLYPSDQCDSWPISWNACLSSCSVHQTADETCSMCRKDCINGCIRSSDCSLCSDSLCRVCLEFNSEVCIECGDNAELVEGVCECNDRYYLDWEDYECKMCWENCKECTGPRRVDCTRCNFGSYDIDGICYSECPAGYTVIDNRCELRDSLYSTLVLDRFLDDIKDSNGLNYISGQNYTDIKNIPDDYDPVPAYRRGYYFRGFNYLQSLITPYSFSHNFSISTWIKSSSQGTILHKADNSTTSFKLSIILNTAFLEFNLPSESHLLPVLSCESVPNESWVHLSFSISYSHKVSTVSCYIDSELKSSKAYPELIFIDSAGLNYTIGASVSSFGYNDFYTGFIYSFCIYTISIDEIYLYTQEYTSCYSCNIQLYSLGCLDNCSIYQVPGDCNTLCSDECVDYGCIRATDCFICTDLLCQQCSSFEYSSCEECVENASGVDCRCNDGFYYDESMNRCNMCDSACKTCYGNGQSKCDRCNEGKFKYETLCYDLCPSGTVVIDEVCVLESTIISILVLDQLTGVISDTYNQNIYYTGYLNSTLNHYLDPSDPIPLYKRGYFFNSSQFLTSETDSIHLGHQFSISMWLRPLQPDGGLYSRCNPSCSLSISLSSFSPILSLYLPNFGLVEFSCHYNIDIDYWSMVTFSVSYNGTDTHLTCMISGDIVSKASYSGVWYSEDINMISTIGHYYSVDNEIYYTGYLYSLCIYSIPLTLEYLTHHIFTTCSDCSIYLYEQQCLSDCDIDQLPENCSISCIDQCKDTGCRRENSCGVCQDQKCRECDRFDSEQCRECVENAKGIPCECETEYADKEIECLKCAENCLECLNSWEGACIKCKDQFVFVDGFCLSRCPNGYNETDIAYCQQLGNIASQFSFNDLKGTITDHIGGEIQFITGLSDAFYPEYESSDPYALYKRGLYFKSSYLTSYYDGYLLGPSCTISISFFPISLSSSTLLTRTHSSLLKFSIKILSSSIHISFLTSQSEGSILQTLSCESTILASMWYHLTVSINNTEDGVYSRCYLDGYLDGELFIPDGYFIDYIDSVWMIGVGAESNDYYEGYVYEITLYTSSIDGNTALSVEYRTDCSGCNRCPISLGECLSSCELNQVPDYQCTGCDESCGKGCRNYKNCVMCDDMMCVRCEDYNKGSCTECKVPAVLHRGSCQCESSKYYDIDRNLCLECDYRCNQCSGPTQRDCIECRYYGYDNVCYEVCPYGTIVSDSECIVSSEAFSTLILNQLTGDISDSTGIVYTSGQDSTTLNSKIDSFDPQPAYKRGYYFTGSSYLTSTWSISLGHKFSLSFLLKPYDINGSIFSILDESSISIHLYLSNSYPALFIQFSSNYSYTSYSSEPIKLQQWTSLTVSIDYSDLSTSISYFYDYEMISVEIVLDHYYQAQPASRLTIGALPVQEFSQFYTGFIYSFCMHGDALNLYDIVNQSFDNCISCSYNVIYEGCLSECDIDKVAENCTADCNTECDAGGCKRTQNCYQCKDERCAECENIDKDECSRCVSNASGNPCECDVEYYWDEENQSCRKCSVGCERCRDLTSESCTSCIVGYYLIYDNCETSCPIGYQQDSESRKCILASHRMAQWSFNTISNTISDSISAYNLTSGSTPSFYPAYDINDPKAAYNRGYYFDGLDDIIDLPPNSIDTSLLSLSRSHAVSVWIRLESLRYSVMLSKVNADMIPLWEIIVDDSMLRIEFLSNGNSVRAKMEYELGIGVWYLASFSVEYDKGNSIVTGFMNGYEVFNVIKEDEYFIDESSYFTLGCRRTTSGLESCMNGYIFSLTLYNSYIDSSNISSEISFSCDGSCIICPAGYNTCLSACGILETMSDSGKCVECLEICKDGCRDNSRCNLCYDLECKKCKDYSMNSCSQCIENAQDYDGDCICEEDKFSYNSGLEECERVEGCEIGCSSCSGHKYWKCNECDSSQELYLFKGSCLPYCPTGYRLNTESNKICTGTDQKIAEFVFDKIEGVVSDSINGFKIIGGSSSKFYPEYDIDDPYPAMNRGYYYDGIKSYMNLPPNSVDTSPILLGQSFSFALWIRTQSTSPQTILTKQDLSGSSYLTYYLQDLHLHLTFLKSPSTTQDLTSIQLGCALSLDSWHFLILQAHHHNGILDLSCSLDSSLDHTTISLKGYFQDSPNFLFKLGSSSSSAGSFNGFIYSLQIYNLFLDSSAISGLFSKSCQGSCKVCPYNECLSNCQFREYESSKICLQCRSGCNQGCVIGDRCSLCYDPLCEVCRDYSSGSCLYCKENAYFSISKTCVCNLGYFYSISTEKCVKCHNSCEACTAGDIGKCTICSIGLYKSPEGLCLNGCPLSYKPDISSRSCVKSGTIGMAVSFNMETLNSIQDSVSKYVMTLGSKLENYPNYDVNDPYIVPNKGLYFQKSAYATLPPHSEDARDILLGNSHTLQTWIKPVYTDTNQFYLMKTDGKGNTPMSLSITPAGTFKASYLLTHITSGSTQVLTVQTVSSSTRALQSNTTWSRLTVIFSYSKSQSSLSIIQNSSPPVISILSNHAFIETTGLNFILGNKYTTEFEGFLQYFKIYNIPISYSDIIKDVPTSCSCGLCIENGCISSCDINQVEIDNICKNCMAECSSGCFRETDCRLNEDELCKYYSGVRYEDCQECMENAQMNSRGCECIENASFNKKEQRCECKDKYQIDNGKCVECYRWIQQSEVSAYFESGYRNVIYEFTVAVNTTGVTCEKIFAQITLNKLGRDYQCSWVNNQKFKIVLGKNYRLRQEDTFINAGILKSVISECGYPMNSLTVYMKYIYSTPVPTSLLNIISAHYTDCGDLIISSSSTSGSTQSELLYKWAVKSDPVVSSIDKYTSTIYTSSSTLTIKNSDLKSTILYVTLTVMNHFSQTNASSTSIDIIKGSGISILFEASVVFGYYRNMLRTYFPRPVATCELSNSLTYTWSIIDVQGYLTEVNTEAFNAAQKSPVLLVIPPYTLPVGSTVKVRMNVVDRVKGLKGYGDINIPVLVSAPVISIDRSNGDIGVQQNLVMSAEKTYDPDDYNQLEFTWSCEYGLGDCSNLITDKTAKKVEIPAYSLKSSNQYSFHLLVYKPFPNQPTQSEKTLKLNVKDYKVPNLNIVNALDGSPVPSVISVSKGVKLKVTHETSEVDYKYSWTQITGGSFIYSTPVNGSRLVVKEYSLQSGQEYTFQVSVSYGAYTTQTQISFKANSPPQYGSFSASPSEGTEYDTVFSLKTSGWEDEDNNYPLQYNFGFLIDEDEKTLNAKNTTSSYYTRLPYTIDLTTLYLNVYDSLEDYTTVYTTVTVLISEQITTNDIYDIYYEELNNSNLSPLETLGVASLLSTGGFNRDYYLYGSYPDKTSSELSELVDVFDLTIEAVNTYLDSLEYHTSQGLYGSISVLNSLTDTPYFKNDTHIRTTILSNLDNIMNQAYTSGVIQNDLTRGAIVASQQTVTLDSDTMMKDSPVMLEVISSCENILATSITNMIPTEVNQESTSSITYKATVEIIDQLDNSVVSLYTNSTAKVQMSDSLSSDISKDYSDYSEVGIILMNIDIKSLNSSQSEPSIVVASLMGYKDGIKTKLNVTLSNSANITIPVNNIPDNWAPTCVYLDETTKEWSKKGCELVKYGDNYAICSCTHFTVFSLVDGFKQADDTIIDSNIGLTVNVDTASDIDIENAVGLYLCISVLTIYFLGGIVACRFDQRDRKKLKSKDLKSLSMMSSQAAPFSHIPSQDSQVNQTEHRKNQQSIDIEKSKSDNIELVGSDDEMIYTGARENLVDPDAIKPENIILEDKNQLKTTETTLKHVHTSTFERQWWRHYKQEHTVLNLFLYLDVSMRRFSRLTVIILNFLGTMFFIGLFYDTENGDDSDSSSEGINSYTWNDFWIMVYSTVIMSGIIVIVSKLLKTTYIDSSKKPEEIKSISRKNKIRLGIGFAVSYIALGYFVWSIVLFSIQFDVQVNHLWAFSSSTSFLWDLFVSESVKIAIKSYLVVLIMRIKKKRKEKKKLDSQKQDSLDRDYSESPKTACENNIPLRRQETIRTRTPRTNYRGKYKDEMLKQSNKSLHSQQEVKNSEIEQEPIYPVSKPIKKRHKEPKI